MATTLHQSRADPHLSVYTMSIPELDFHDARYHTFVSPPTQPTNRHTSAAIIYPYSISPEPRDVPGDQQSANINQQSQGDENPTSEQTEVDGNTGSRSQQQQLPFPPQNIPISHALPPGAAQTTTGRFSFEENMGLAPFSTGELQRPVLLDSSGQARYDSPRIPSPPVRSSTTSSGQDLSSSTPRPTSPDSRFISSPRTPQITSPDSIGTTNTNPLTSPLPSPMLPPPTPYSHPMALPVSPSPRAYAQKPVYVTPTATPSSPLKPVQAPPRPPPVPPEEVCLECTMRDQDMAEVDVTSPGVWERDSDVLYDELLRREQEERASGYISADPSRPRAIGGRLTEKNLRIWLSVNPREPASRHQTLEKYIKSQRKLLEAEALAHSRAMQEARQLENKMKDTYSQLRRSAYDLGSTSACIDDSGGVRIEPPSSPPYRAHSRDVTLLENGMIVEHVDVRKAEKEARERKRKEEKRARKSSRSSGVDVTSIYSFQSTATPLVEGGIGAQPYTYYSPTGSGRPSSVLTTPMPPRSYSQASFDVQSLGSSSPRRSRFSSKNLGAGWRSQDSLAPSGISGSMIDMHVALQRERAHPRRVGVTSIRQSQIWPTKETDVVQSVPMEKPKKKENGLQKLWRIVTGTPKAETNANNQTPSLSHTNPEDDFPLAPPPPLSFLVDRSPLELPAARQGSTQSVNSISPRNGLTSPGMSPPTAPSSLLPSPASSGRPGGDREVVIEGRNISGAFDNRESLDPKMDETLKPSFVGNVYPYILDTEMRPRVLSSPSLTSAPSRPISISDREKSLPPLPDEALTPQLGRPLTVFDTRRAPPNVAFLASQNGYDGPEVRRQSFSGMASRTNNFPHNIRAQTALPRTIAYDSGQSLSPKYDEFANSLRSLGRLEHVEEHPSAQSPTPSAKRKSKFGFGSLFGKKSSAAHESTQDTDSTMRMSGSYHDNMSGSYPNGMTAGPSTIRQVTGSRMSVTSRRNLEELVDQDPEFIAYRYPSNDERLNLLR